MGASAEDFSLGTDGQGLAPGPAERSFTASVVGPVAAVDPVRPFQATALERRGVDLLVAEAPTDLVLTRFTASGRGEGTTVEELQRTLRSTAFSNQLDRLRDDVQQDLQLEKTVTISVAGVSLGMSLVYVLWLIRGGVLMGSYLSALPAWRVLDPLPVLSRVDEEAEEDDEALDAVSDTGGNPLRGFG